MSIKGGWVKRRAQIRVQQRGFDQQLVHHIEIEIKSAPKMPEKQGAGEAANIW